MGFSLQDLTDNLDKFLHGAAPVVNNAARTFVPGVAFAEDTAQRYNQTPQQMPIYQRAALALPQAPDITPFIQKAPQLNLPKWNTGNQIGNVVANLPQSFAEGIANSPRTSFLNASQMGQDIGLNQVTPQKTLAHLGGMAQLPLNIASFGTGSAVLGAAKPLVAKIAQGALAGAGYGGAFGVSQGLQDNVNAPDVLTQLKKAGIQGLQGAAVGAALGGTIPAAIKIGGRMAGNPQVQAAVKNQSGAIKLGTGLPFEKEARDVIRATRQLAGLNGTDKYSPYQIQLMAENEKPIYDMLPKDKNGEVQGDFWNTVSDLLHNDQQDRVTKLAGKMPTYQGIPQELQHVADNIKGKTYDQAKRIISEMTPAGKLRAGIKVDDQSAQDVLDRLYSVSQQGGYLNRDLLSKHFPDAKVLSDLKNTNTHSVRNGANDVQNYNETQHLSDLYGGKTPAPDEKVPVYRGVSVANAKIRPGDYVTPSADHALGFSRGKYANVVRDNIPAKDLIVTQMGTDHPEYIYYPKDYKAPAGAGEQKSPISFKQLYDSVNNEQGGINLTAKVGEDKPMLAGGSTNEAIAKAKQDIQKALELKKTAPDTAEWDSGIKTKGDYDNYIKEVQAWIDKKQPNKNITLSDIQNQGGRPQHQIDIENAFNKGDYKGAQKIVDTLPQNDPYKQMMQNIINTVSNEKGGINLKAFFGGKTPPAIGKDITAEQYFAIVNSQKNKQALLDAHNGLNNFFQTHPQGAGIQQALLNKDKAGAVNILKNLPPEHQNNIMDWVNTLTHNESGGMNPVAKIANPLAKDPRNIDAGTYVTQKGLQQGLTNLSADEANVLTEKGQGLLPRLATQAGATPRELMATGDLSAAGRQGLELAPTHPVAWSKALVDEVKSLFSQKATDAVNNRITQMPTYNLMKEHGLALNDVDTANLTQREEMFQASWLKDVPLVRQSNRAFVTFLNSLRADVFNTLAKQYQEKGMTDPKLFDDLAKFVNQATGRGDLGRFADSGKLLSQGLFAPRLIASHFNFFDPRFYASMEPAVRKEAIKSAIGFAGSIATVLGAAKLFYPDSVDTDMRSADWGKIKIGDHTRIDVTGGFGSFVRLLAEVYSQETKSSTTGLVSPQDWGTTAGKFLQNKENPIIGLLTGIGTGKAPGSKTPGSFELIPQLVGMVHPLFWSDLHDLIQEQGLVKGTALSALPLFGFSQQTYGNQIPTVVGKNKDGTPKIGQTSPPSFDESVSNFLAGTKYGNTNLTPDQQQKYQQQKAAKDAKALQAQNAAPQAPNLFGLRAPFTAAPKAAGASDTTSPDVMASLDTTTSSTPTSSNSQYEKSKDSPQSIFDTIGTYGTGFIKDPTGAWTAVSSGQPIRKVVGNSVIVERQKGLGALDQGDKATQVDHKIALELGGTNDKSNLQTLSVRDNMVKGKIENYLASQLKSGAISKAEAQQRDLKWQDEIPNLPEPYKSTVEHIQNSAIVPTAQAASADQTIASNGPAADVNGMQNGAVIDQTTHNPLEPKVKIGTHTIDTTFWPKDPVLVGNDTFDKNQISAFNSGINQKEKDVIALYNNKNITREVLMQQIQQLEGMRPEKQTKAKTTKAKGATTAKGLVRLAGPKIKISVSKSKLPSLKMASPKNLTFANIAKNSSQRLYTIKA